MAFVGAVVGTVMGLPLVIYLISPALKAPKEDDWVSMGALENLPMGVPTLLTFTRTKVNGWERKANSHGIYIWRRADTELTTLSNLCTHLGCRVSWHSAANEYVCPCHDGHFASMGKCSRGLRLVRWINLKTRFKIEIS
jgi:menaquinol-cytochrome c reductase iron-sulfur subunit